jgi:hypothetical protein
MEVVMAYRYCKWCNGRGCLSCAPQKQIDKEEAQKEREARLAIAPVSLPEPLLVIDNPEDIKLFTDAIGSAAIEKAFGVGGGGIEEVKANIAKAKTDIAAGAQ